MKTKLIYLLLATFLVGTLVVSCKKQGEETTPSQVDPIQFNAFLKEGETIRPLNSDESRAVAGSLEKGVWMIARTSAVANATSGFGLFINSPTRLLFDGTDAPFFWLGDRNRYYNFSALMTAKDHKMTDVKIKTDKDLTINYTTNPNPLLQEDVLWASVNNTKIGDVVPTVNFYFQHRMSRVIFKLRRWIFGPALYEVMLKITYNATNGPYATNTISWQPGADATPTTRLSGASLPLMSQALDITPSTNGYIYAGDLILLPQDLGAGSWLTVEMSYKLDPADATTITIKTELKGPIKLEAGRQTEYIIGYLVEANQLIVESVTLNDWVTKEIYVGEYK